MSIAEGITSMGRAWAESIMGATCTIVHLVDRGPINEGTSEYDQPVTTTVYDGPCRLRFLSPIVREADVQGQSLARQEGVLSLPVMGSGAILPDDIVTITANLLDPESVGQKLVIRGGHIQTFSTARRFPIEIVS